MSISPRAELCVLFVAFSYEYFIMAVNSARTVRESGSHVRIKLITNVPITNASLLGRPLFDDIEVHDVPDEENRTFKINLPSLTDHEFNLYLDADTEVYRPLQKLLPLLHRFDLALRSLPYATPKKYEVVPGVSTTDALLSEYNGGVILFRRTPATQEFFQLWSQHYNRMGLGLDQPALLSAAFAPHGATIGPLGAAWNAKPTVEADLGLIRRRPQDIAILHYRDGFMWPPIGKNLAVVHRSVELEWARRVPRVNRQIADYERRAKVYGSPLSRYRGGRKLIKLASAFQARLFGQDPVSLHKVMAKKGPNVDRTDRP